jgi:hypothetical protein
MREVCLLFINKLFISNVTNICFFEIFGNLHFRSHNQLANTGRNHAKHYKCQLMLRFVH